MKKTEESGEDERKCGLTENPHSESVHAEGRIVLEGYTSSSDIVGGFDRSLLSVGEEIFVVDANKGRGGTSVSRLAGDGESAD